MSESRTVLITLGDAGIQQAYNTVSVHKQVEGHFTAVGYRGGQDVEQGTILARIDPPSLCGAVDGRIGEARTGSRHSIELVPRRLDYVSPWARNPATLD